MPVHAAGQPLSSFIKENTKKNDSGIKSLKQYYLNTQNKIKLAHNADSFPS